MKKIDWLIIFSIVFISVLVLKDLFRPGMYTSHDGIHQVVRFYYFDQIFHEGQFPQRWVQGLMNGFGYPLFIFSYHLPWFIAETIHIFGSSIIDSVKMTFLVGFAASGITMYLFQKDIYGRLPAIAGSVIYLFAPYRFSNIFVRASIGDATAFIFAPLVLWSIWKLGEGWDWKWMSIGGIGIAGLILSHAMVAALFIAVFMLYVLFSSIRVKNKLNYLFTSLSTVLLGIGISAYYFTPSVLERSNTKFQSLMGQIFIGSYFPNLSDLIYSKWGYGVFHSNEGAMSIQLGITQWIVIFLATIVILWQIFNKKKTHAQKIMSNFGRVLLLIFFVSIFMMLPVSLPIWKFVSQLFIVDFPWRILSVSTFLVAVCAGLLVFLSGKYKIALTVILCIFSFYFNRNHMRINETLPWDLPFIISLERTTNTYDEYTPKWVRPELIKENAPKVDFTDLKSTFNITKNTSNKIDLSVNSQSGGNLLVNTIYYPGWEAAVNGNKTGINYDNGLIRLPVGKGNSRVELRFRETPMRKFSDILSVISILIAISFLLKHKKS